MTQNRRKFTASGKRAALSVLAALLLIPGSVNLRAQSIGFRGQVSGWATVNPDQCFAILSGLRYIPELSIETPLSSRLSFSVEASANGYAAVWLRSEEPRSGESDLKPYRLWMRVATRQLEVRVGLQKISFGSASLLRPLMWFDRIDPRDPLQLTDGVYGLLVKYTFLNNANVWAWGLVGNDDLKGFEFIPSDGRKPEFGGRIQVPVPAGEFAVTYHRRHADLEKGLLGQLPLGTGTFSEDRYGIDGKWDLGIGFWFEGSLVHRHLELPGFKFQHLLTVGADYTFPLCNGLTTVLEYFSFQTADKVLGAGEGLEFTALSLNYPIGLLDAITGIVYRDWENKEWYRFINFQRMYDRWSIYLMAFWNPETFQIYPQLSEGSLFTGKGFQIMIVFNH